MPAVGEGEIKHDRPMVRYLGMGVQIECVLACQATSGRCSHGAARLQTAARDCRGRLSSDCRPSDRPGGRRRAFTTRCASAHGCLALCDVSSLATAPPILPTRPQLLLRPQRPPRSSTTASSARTPSRLRSSAAPSKQDFYALSGGARHREWLLIPALRRASWPSVSGRCKIRPRPTDVYDLAIPSGLLQRLRRMKGNARLAPKHEKATLRPG